METAYTISIHGQRAVDTGYELCKGVCYQPIYHDGKFCGCVEVVVDAPGQYNGRDNKWVDVSGLDRDMVEPSLAELAEIGFKGCKAVIIEEHSSEATFAQETLCALVI